MNIDITAPTPIRINVHKDFSSGTTDHFSTKIRAPTHLNQGHHAELHSEAQLNK